MLMFNFNRGSTLGTPLFDNRKCNSLVAQALISGGASLVGGAFGGMSQSKLQRQNEAFQQQQALQAHNWAVQDATTAYQRQQEATAEQEAYNSPLASRARLEQAGYNPFLADGSSAGNLTSVPQVPQSSEQSQSPVMAQGNLLGGIAQGIQGAVGSFATLWNSLSQGKAQIAQANYNQAYADRLARQNNLMINDSDGGSSIHAVDASFYTQVAQAGALFQAANRDHANTVFQDMLNTLNASCAVDEDGNTIPNADGSVMTNMQYNNALEQRKSMASISQLAADATSLAAQGKNLDADTLLKKYNLKYILPEQKAQIIASINQINSNIDLNSAQYKAAIGQAFDSTAGAYLKQAFTKTENAMRPGRVREQNGKGASGQIDTERFSGKTNKFFQGLVRGARDASSIIPGGLLWNLK